jgi:hypothetical protein
VNNKTGGSFGYLIGGLAMGSAYPPHSAQERLDGSSLDGSSPGCGEYTDDEHMGDSVSLLEENARLRRLVIKLSEIILRNVVDRR